PFDSASLRSGRTEGVDFPALPFVLSVALRAKSKHERLFQQPAKVGATLCGHPWGRAATQGTSPNLSPSPCMEETEPAPPPLVSSLCLCLISLSRVRGFFSASSVLAPYQVSR